MPDRGDGRARQKRVVAEMAHRAQLWSLWPERQMQSTRPGVPEGFLAVFFAEYAPNEGMVCFPFIELIMAFGSSVT